MTKTFFFYDLETSGLNPREDRIMQFAGQRTDMNLVPIGEPVNLLVRLGDDTLPSPDALLVTGITPQKTVEEGYSEAEFAKILTDEIFTPDTIVVGFNNVRFDDEFIRHLFWRNFHDPYEWSWKDGRSRWDLLDVVRLTRALRPEGINWPVDDKGVPTNRLELITKENGISHDNAHDALSDVVALIDVAKLIKAKQPQLFEYLLKMRDKKEVQRLVNLDDRKPFVYTSGRYDAEYNKTTVAFPLALADFGNVFVYDLRYDPTNWVNKTDDELEKIIQTPWGERDESYQALPVKKFQYNRCPVVAPLGVLEQADGWSKIQLNIDDIESHIDILKRHPAFAERVAKVLLRKPEYAASVEAEAKLYDGFVSDRDKLRAEVLRNADINKLKTYNPDFSDQRLSEMLPHYKARNYPHTLSDDDRQTYEAYRINHLKRQLPGFIKSMTTQAQKPDITSHNQYILEELRLWMESILPDDEA